MRHIKNLEAAMARTDGGEPAFVVLNDDVSDRASAGEFETVDKLMTGWMHDTWPEKVSDPCPPLRGRRGLVLTLCCRCAGSYRPRRSRCMSPPAVCLRTTYYYC